MPSFSTFTACLFLAVHAGGLVSAAPAPVLSTVDAAVQGAHVERANVAPEPRKIEENSAARAGPNQRAVEDASFRPEARKIDENAIDRAGPNGRAVEARDASRKRDDVFTVSDPDSPNINRRRAPGARRLGRAEEDPEDFFTPPPDPNAPPANDVGDGSRARAVEAPAGIPRKRDDAGPLDSDDAGPF